MIGVFLAAALAADVAQGPVDTSWVRVKRAIAEQLTPEQLEAHKQRLARSFAGRRLPGRGLSGRAPETPGDSCAAATYELGNFPYMLADTTVGAADDYDLPADTTSPTCTAASSCTGAGPAGSLPRGAIYTGTGTAPDRAFKVLILTSCTLTVSMDPTDTQDLALIVYQAACSSSLTDCVCVDDTGLAGAAEQVTLDATAGTIYYVVVDGYSSGGTPPGPAGPFTLTLSGPGCGILVPVELQRLSVE